MLTWLLALLVLLIVVAGMAVGVMAGRKPIAGSCGGLANVGLASCRVALALCDIIKILFSRQYKSIYLYCSAILSPLN